MSGQLLQFDIELASETCCNAECGITFAMPRTFQMCMRETKNNFFCPRGHPQHYFGKSPLDEEKARVEMLRKQLAWANEREAAERASKQRALRKATALKGVVTRTKARVGNGVCPCCNRTFQQLARHMQHKHPEYSGTRQRKNKAPAAG